MPENYDTVEVTATMEAAAELGIRQGQAGAHPDDEPIPREENDDVPRAVVVRLTVHKRERRRIETVLMSAVGLAGEWDEHDRDDHGDRPDPHRSDQNRSDQDRSDPHRGGERR